MKKILIVIIVFLGACFTDRTRVDPPTDSDAYIADDSGMTSDQDPNSLRVIETYPRDGAVKVARDSTVTATFSNDILASSVDESSFTLNNSDGDLVAGTVTFDAATKTATFTPKKPFQMLTSYTVVLDGSVLDVDDNALFADYSWSFQTSDGQWASPDLLETSNAGDAIQPKIAFDHLNNAMAIWSQSDGGDIFSIWSNRFDGSTWGGTDLVESADTLSAFSPEIVFDSNGNAIAAWSQGLGGIVVFGSETNIWASRFDGAWRTAEKISDDTEYRRDISKLKVDNKGNTFVLISFFSRSASVISVRRFNGINWKDPSGIASAPIAAVVGGVGTESVSYPSLAVASSGNAIAIFAMEQFGATPNKMNSIFTSYYDGSNWKNYSVIETDEAGPAEKPKMEFDSEGNAVAVWQQSDGTRMNIWANRFDGAGWGNAERIEREDSGDAVNPQIAFDGDGNAIAVWEHSDGTRINIWANRFDGTKWGDAKMIGIESNGDAEAVQIAVDNKGNALAVWLQSDGTTKSVWANRYNISDKSWGEAKLLEEDDAGDAGKPEVAIDREGNAFAVWAQSDGTRANIWASRFE